MGFGLRFLPFPCFSCCCGRQVWPVRSALPSLWKLLPFRLRVGVVSRWCRCAAPYFFYILILTLALSCLVEVSLVIGNTGAWGTGHDGSTGLFFILLGLSFIFGEILKARVCDLVVTVGWWIVVCACCLCRVCCCVEFVRHSLHTRFRYFFLFDTVLASFALRSSSLFLLFGCRFLFKVRLSSWSIHAYLALLHAIISHYCLLFHSFVRYGTLWHLPFFAGLSCCFVF